MKGRTTIIVAHRLSTIRDADKIVVVHKGEVVEQGNHDELLVKKGYYYDLVQSQTGGVSYAQSTRSINKIETKKIEQEENTQKKDSSEVFITSDYELRITNMFRKK